MQKKIYFNNKPLFLVDEITKEVDEYLHQKETIFIDELDEHTVRTMIYEMGLPEIYRGVFLHNNVETLLNSFKENLSLIQAAGGFIYTQDHKVLLIFRRGKWDLPKGKLDEKESLETCALREVKEETGLKHVQLVQPLIVTYHTYRQSGEHILKESHWYVMKAEMQALTPQTEEDIEKCEWVPVDALAGYMSNTHASILDVVNAGVSFLNKANSV